MKPRFEPHFEPTGNSPSPRLIDPEAYDASEQQFAASLEVKPTERRFVVDEGPEARRKDGEETGTLDAGVGPTPALAVDGNASGIEIADSGTNDPAASEAVSSAKPTPVTDSDSWREEVAARMNRYRAHKRPRTPRYPSLQLKFDALDSGATARALPSTPDLTALEESSAYIMQTAQPEAFVEESHSTSAVIPPGKILEFPVPSAPLPAIDELAEPVFDRPRILDVPEVVPPPPALGGILIEPAEETSREKRQGFELPLIAAPFSRRILAGGIDALIVASAFALFAYTFFRITALVLEIRVAAAVGAGLLAVFWAGYQYLMLVHAGTTVGLKLSKLRLSRFDGTHVPFTLRRWRVLASVLSGLSLGLGYAWCFLDEDRLCWHDRITHTYMAPISQ